MNRLKVLKYFLFLLMFAGLGLCLVSCRKKSEPKISEAELKKNKPEINWNQTSITGIVHTPDRQDHSGILVYAAGKSLMSYTDAEGNFTFLNVPLGTYEFFARMETYQIASLGVVTVEAGPDTPAQSVHLSTIILEKAPVPKPEEAFGDLIGKVELETGDPADGVLVQILGTLFKTVTDEEGVYRIYNLAPKTYTLNLSKGGYMSQTTSVNVVPGEPAFVGTVQMLPVVEPQKYRRILGGVEMYDLKGNLTNKFEGVIVALEGTSLVALPDGAGKFTFDKIPPGKYTLVSAAPGFKNRNKIDLDLTNLEYTNVSVILDELPSESAKRALIRGMVKLEKQEDHSGALVALTGTSLVAVSDVEGRYALSNVPEGTYSLLAQAEGYLPMVVDRIDVKPGEEVELELINLAQRVEPPQVIYTDPGDGQTDVLIQKTTPLYVRFSKKMKPETLRRAFSISPSVEYRLFAGRQNRQSDYDLLYVELLGATDKNPLLFDTRYTVTITTLATDFENLGLAEDYQFAFATGKASVTGTAPYEGEMNALVNLQNPIYMFLNAGINPETVNEGMISLSPSPETVASVRVHQDPDTGWSVLRIFVQLTPATRYTLRLDSGVRTTTGSSISNLPYTVHFTTSERREATDLGPR